MRYMPTNSGSTRGAVTGAKISYKKGVITEDLPKGELDHCGFKPVSEKAKGKSKKDSEKVISKEDVETAVVSEDETEKREPSPQPSSKGEDLDDRFLALPKDTKFPFNYSGSWFYLSNGEKVNGEENALKAQEALESESN